MSISMDHMTAWELLPLVKSLVTETERLEATITALRAELARKDAALRVARPFVGYAGYFPTIMAEIDAALSPAQKEGEA